MLDVGRNCFFESGVNGTLLLSHLEHHGGQFKWHPSKRKQKTHELQHPVIDHYCLLNILPAQGLGRDLFWKIHELLIIQVWRRSSDIDLHEITSEREDGM